MFDIGFWELILLFGLGLLILGPEKLPRVARTAGSYIGQARAMVRKLQREMEREIAFEDAKKRYDETASSESTIRPPGAHAANPDNNPAPADEVQPGDAQPTSPAPGADNPGQ